MQTEVKTGDNHSMRYLTAELCTWNSVEQGLKKGLKKLGMHSASPHPLLPLLAQETTWLSHLHSLIAVALTFPFTNI